MLMYATTILCQWVGKFLSFLLVFGKSITSHIMYVLQFSDLCFHLLIFFKEIVFCIENPQHSVKLKLDL